MWSTGVFVQAQESPIKGRNLEVILVPTTTPRLQHVAQSVRRLELENSPVPPSVTESESSPEKPLKPSRPMQSVQRFKQLGSPVAVSVTEPESSPERGPHMSAVCIHVLLSPYTGLVVLIYIQRPAAFGGPSNISTENLKYQFKCAGMDVSVSGQPSLEAFCISCFIS